MAFENETSTTNNRHTREIMNMGVDVKAHEPHTFLSLPVALQILEMFGLLVCGVP